MTFEQYVAGLPTKLSQVKHLILKTLWESGNSFPRGWVRSSTLLNLTQQKYFDRRTRELRDELGCDIDTEPHNGEHCYRLASTNLTKFNPRSYLTSSQKKWLFNKANYNCQVCGRNIPPGVQGLQADHKIPLIRGGSHEENNWQAICNECNVGKRRACEGCGDDCKKCPWAFPEKAGLVTLVRIPQPIVQGIRDIGANGQKEVERVIISALERFLSSK